MPREVAVLQENLLARIRAEYLEMPGLRLTLEQAQRLCGVDRQDCQSVFDSLVSERFLCVRPNGLYSRVADGDVQRTRRKPPPVPNASAVRDVAG